MLKAETKPVTETYAFPGGSQPNATEWAGTSIGKSNTITRTKSRTPSHDKVIDEKPGRREELLDAVVHYLGARKSGEFFVHDVVVHGIRVRATTNSPHLAQFWKDNWYSVSEWQASTGVEPSGKPQVWVYAFCGVENQPEAAYYSRSGNTVVFFNTAYYGQLKSWVLGAVGRVLSQEYGIHSIHGAVVEKDKKGVLYIAPTGTGKSTSSYGLMNFKNTRFHSDDWVYVRYAYTTKTGKKFSPLSIQYAGKEEARGYQCFQWLENHANADAAIKGLTLEKSQTVDIPVKEVDFSKPLEAYAFLSEKVFYLRCNLVESFPQAAYSILQSHLENVPDINSEFLKEHENTLENNLKTIRTTPVNFIRSYFEKWTDTQIKDTLGRLFSFDNARAMLDITKVFEPQQVFVNPLEPVHLTTVMLLKRNFKEDSVLETLSQDRFMERLLIGETPTGTREIAYNGYRLVNDQKESEFVKQIEAHSKSSHEPLYHIFSGNTHRPVSLTEEFELFRSMYKACTCYDLNTILQKDPGIPDRRTAVETTMNVIARAMDTPSAKELKYDIKTYRDFLKPA